MVKSTPNNVYEYGLLDKAASLLPQLFSGMSPSGFASPYSALKLTSDSMDPVQLLEM
jgi:hypothetical protein